LGAEGSKQSTPGVSPGKELRRWRVNVFLFGLLLIAISETAASESDIFLHAVDDYADITVAIIALALIVAWRKGESWADLRKLNNVLGVLAAVVLVATLFAISQEIGGRRISAMKYPPCSSAYSCWPTGSSETG